jgi:hypothetical protein
MDAVSVSSFSTLSFLELWKLVSCSVATNLLSVNVGYFILNYFVV